MFAVSLLILKGVVMQTKKQKQEKALAYWERELRKPEIYRFSYISDHRKAYIEGQIKILRRKLGAN